MTNTVVYDYSRLLAQENSGALFYRSSLMRFVVGRTFDLGISWRCRECTLLSWPIPG